MAIGFNANNRKKKIEGIVENSVRGGPKKAPPKKAPTKKDKPLPKADPEAVNAREAAIERQRKKDLEAIKAMNAKKRGE